MLNRILKARTAVLFVVGLGIIIFTVVVALIRNSTVLPSLIILGTTLCGVGITQTRDGNGNGSK